MTKPARACSFDFGQTLAGIDAGLLAQKLAKLGIVAKAAALDRASPLAWGAYDAAVRSGVAGHPWKLFMRTLLENGVEPRSRASVIELAVDALWDDQPKVNLWRRALPDMIDLVRELRTKAVPYAILSNSEGRLVELLEEIGLAELFPIVADSGRLGIEKPDPRIFQWVGEKLGIELADLLHVGDSLGADVHGAERAGARAIWFRSAVLGMSVPDPAPSDVVIATTAAELREHLRRVGLLA
jgi:HAD superfamily hydrolase (TIGR01549 family)